MNAIEKLANAIYEIYEKKTKPLETEGIVKRVDSDTAWVEFNGASIATPVKKTISCRKGDKVQIRSSGGEAHIAGNLTAPPTDDKRADKAVADAKEASTKATGYMTDRSDGSVFIHEKGGSDNPTDKDASGVLIGRSVDIIRNGESVAEYGDVSRVGKTDDYNIETSPNGVKFNKGSDTISTIKVDNEQTTMSVEKDPAEAGINMWAGGNTQTASTEIYANKNSKPIPVNSAVVILSEDESCASASLEAMFAKKSAGIFVISDGSGTQMHLVADEINISGLFDLSNQVFVEQKTSQAKQITGTSGDPYGYFDIDVSETGKQPIGIVGVAIRRSSDDSIAPTLYLRGFDFTSDTNARVWVRNSSSSAVNGYAEAKILYLRA